MTIVNDSKKLNNLCVMQKERKKFIRVIEEVAQDHFQKNPYHKKNVYIAGKDRWMVG